MAAHNFDAKSVKARCTLITDASWCPDTHAAGFGGWCAGSNGSGKVGGAIVDTLPSSQVAEAVAVCNALYLAIQNGYVVESSTLLIQIDNTNVIRLYKGEGQPSNKHEIKAFNWFTQTVKRMKLDVEFRYIKSHHNADQAKHYCHNLCDREAKAFMRHRRAAIRLEQMREVHGLGREKNSDAVSDKFKELVIKEMRLLHTSRTYRDYNSPETNQELDQLFEMDGW